MISSAFVISMIIVCIIIILLYSATQLRKYASLNKLPGPPAVEVLQMMLGNKSRYDIYQYLISLTKKYGPVLKMWVKPFKPIVVVADVEVMNRILLSKDHLCKTKSYDFIIPYVGEGLGVTSKVDLWKHDRKICNTAFQPSTINGFLPLISKHTNKLLEKLNDHIDKIVDIHPFVHLYALDMAFEFATKSEQNFQENMDVAYLNARNEFFRGLSKRIYSVYLQNDIIFKFSKYFKSMNKAIATMKRFTYDIVQLEESQRKDERNEKSRLHLIDVLFAHDVDIKHLQDQIDTFIAAAHDTTGETICFALYELSRCPKVQQRLFEEIASLIGDKVDIPYHILPKMTYLEAVVKESLRLHTVIPAIERTLSGDVDINGVHYPKGTRFVFSLTGIHTSSRYYENPYEFDPERFMPENAHKISKQSFVPFSVGPRNCIGQLFAMFQLKYSVARIIQQYEVLPVEDHVLKVICEFVAKSMTGIPVILKKRQN